MSQWVDYMLRIKLVSMLCPRARERGVILDLLAAVCIVMLDYVNKRGRKKVL